MSTVLEEVEVRKNHLILESKNFNTEETQF